MAKQQARNGKKHNVPPPPLYKQSLQKCHPVQNAKVFSGVLSTSARGREQSWAAGTAAPPVAPAPASPTVVKVTALTPLLLRQDSRSVTLRRNSNEKTTNSVPMAQECNCFL